MKLLHSKFLAFVAGCACMCEGIGENNVRLTVVVRVGGIEALITSIPKELFQSWCHACQVM